MQTLKSNMAHAPTTLIPPLLNSTVNQILPGNFTTPGPNFHWTVPGAPTLSPTNHRSNHSDKSENKVFNGTGYYIEEEVTESMFSDLKTLVLACMATLVPLVIIMVTAFAIRILWKRYKNRKDREKYDSIHRDCTSDSTKPLHAHLLNDTTKQSEAAHVAINTEETSVEVCQETTSSNSQSQSNRSNNVTNGSIITMTLKNNHLIVETEERNDIEEDSRETTVRYSPSARDGVFVVEVQQGVRRSPSSGGPTSITEPEKSCSLSDQCALVHNPPERFSDEETLGDLDLSESNNIDETSPEPSSPKLLSDFKTGFSTSNTSLNSLKQSYCYSNQQGYDIGNYGYNIYNGYVNEECPKSVEKVSNKPKITSAILKNPMKKKSISLDIPITCNGGFKRNMAQNPSLDNVRESNGFEDFDFNLHRTKVIENNAIPEEQDTNDDVSDS